jgi:uncharacterized OsmC-like protein
MTQASTTTEAKVNGVPVDRLVETMRAIRKDPRIATFVFRARNAWQDGGHNRATAKEFFGACAEDATRTRRFVFDMDEPSVLLGGDRGANPVELLLAALSGCLTTSLVYHAAARGIAVEEVESRYEGDLDLRGFLGMDASVRNGYAGIRVVFRVKADAPPEVLDELVRVARERSPVFDVVSRGTTVLVVRDPD